MKPFILSLFTILLPAVVFAAHGEGNRTTETGVSRTSHPPATGVSKGHGGHVRDRNSTEASCRQIDELEHIIDLAANTTKLDRLPQSEQSRIQSLAANATTELNTLKTNTTLVTICQAKKDCGELQRLEKLNVILGNATTTSRIEGFHGRGGKNFTAEELSEFKANITARLTVLESNSTLVAECKGLAGGNSTAGTNTGVTATGIAAQAVTNASIRSQETVGTWAIAVFIFWATFAC